jgi:hypothetical protein
MLMCASVTAAGAVWRVMQVAAAADRRSDAEEPPGC